VAADRSRRQAAGSLIDKFSSGNLTRDDIINSSLPQDAQTHAIAMMARGPAAEGNDALHRQLFMQALNGAVQDKSDILPHLARHCR
jgi:Ca2+-binding EF-hand superfamily protein